MAFIMCKERVDWKEIIAFDRTATSGDRDSLLVEAEVQLLSDRSVLLLNLDTQATNVALSAIIEPAVEEN